MMCSLVSSAKHFDAAQVPLSKRIMVHVPRVQLCCERVIWLMRLQKAQLLLSPSPALPEAHLILNPTKPTCASCVMTASRLRCLALLLSAV